MQAILLFYEMCGYYLPLTRFLGGTPSQIPDFSYNYLTSYLHALPNCCARQKHPV